MKLQVTSIADIPTIMEIVGEAQLYLAKLGIDQWQDGYPTEEQIRLDIKNKDSYVIVDDTGRIMATTVFTTKTEATYKAIEGKWLTSEETKYGVIHRLAVSDSFRGSGIAKFIFDTCENKLREMGINSMRIDTHEENKGMQHLLKQLGYHYCGVIYIEDGAKRLAFEKLI